MRHELIGYLLGVLDPAEQRLVEQQLARDENLRREMERIRAKLESLRDEECDPPPDLVARTCESVEAFSAEHKPTPAQRMKWVSSAPTGGNKWRLSDFLVTAGICMAAAMLFFPAIASSRFQSQIVACQENITQIGRALQSYSNFHYGYLPPVPTAGNMGSAGCYAVILRDQDLIVDDHVFLCPSSAIACDVKSFDVPSCQQLRQARGRRLDRLQRLMGGSYAYTLGYSEGENYFPTRNKGRSYFVIMADSPGDGVQGVLSKNHGGSGQNVLFEDYHVQFISGCTTVEEGDGFFVNHFGLMAAGVDSEDAVVGSSHVPPLYRSQD